jgi:EpsI family protein
MGTKMSWQKVSLLSVVMLLMAIIAMWATPTEYLSNIKQREPLINYIESTLDNWKKDDTNQVLITSAVLDEKLESAYSDLINEAYLNTENKRVMLSVAYSDNQRNGLAVHLPEACYPAQGFEILEEKKIPITLNDGSQLIAKYMKTKRGSRIEPLIYWTVAGEYLYGTDFERKEISIKYALKNIIADGLIFRVSMVEPDDDVALSYMNDFIKDFYDGLVEKGQSRFFGNYE